MCSCFVLGPPATVLGASWSRIGGLLERFWGSRRGPLGALPGPLGNIPRPGLSWRALGLSDGFGKGRSGRWEGPENIQQRLPEGAPKKPKRNKITYFILFRLVLVFK